MIFKKVAYMGNGVTLKFSIRVKWVEAIGEILFAYLSIASGIVGALGRAIVMIVIKVA
jgi:hypothetical protein